MRRWFQRGCKKLIRNGNSLPFASLQCKGTEKGSLFFLPHLRWIFLCGSFPSSSFFFLRKTNKNPSLSPSREPHKNRSAADCLHKPISREETVRFQTWECKGVPAPTCGHPTQHFSLQCHPLNTFTLQPVNATHATTSKELPSSFFFF